MDFELNEEPDDTDFLGETDNINPSGASDDSDDGEVIGGYDFTTSTLMSPTELDEEEKRTNDLFFNGNLPETARHKTSTNVLREVVLYL
jgi:hypothetical protein